MQVDPQHKSQPWEEEELVSARGLLEDERETWKLAKEGEQGIGGSRGPEGTKEQGPFPQGCAAPGNAANQW